VRDDARTGSTDFFCGMEFTFRKSSFSTFLARVSPLTVFPSLYSPPRYLMFVPGVSRFLLSVLWISRDSLERCLVSFFFGVPFYVFCKVCVDSTSLFPCGVPFPPVPRIVCEVRVFRLPSILLVGVQDGLDKNHLFRARFASLLSFASMHAFSFWKLPHAPPPSGPPPPPFRRKNMTVPSVSPSHAFCLGQNDCASKENPIMIPSALLESPVEEIGE